MGVLHLAGTPAYENGACAGLVLVPFAFVMETETGLCLPWRKIHEATLFRELLGLGHSLRQCNPGQLVPKRPEEHGCRMEVGIASRCPLRGP